MSQSKPTKQKRKTGVTKGLSLVGIVILAILVWYNSDNQRSELPDDVATPAIALSQPAANDSQSEAALSTRPDSDEAQAEQAPPRYSDLPVIAYQDLPPEAHDTISLIDQGGPFPYSKDGSTFQNREELLPDRPPPYYKEYTVITPGESDRGARRIVAGDIGELYYTADHYASFHEVIR